MGESKYCLTGVTTDRPLQGPLIGGFFFFFFWDDAGDRLCSSRTNIHSYDLPCQISVRGVQVISVQDTEKFYIPREGGSTHVKTVFSHAPVPFLTSSLLSSGGVFFFFSFFFLFFKKAYRQPSTTLSPSPPPQPSLSLSRSQFPAPFLGLFPLSLFLINSQHPPLIIPSQTPTSHPL